MSGEYVSSEVVNWLDNKKDSKPFFLYVAFTEVHSPGFAQKYLDMYSQYMSAYQKQHPDLFYGDWADKPAWCGNIMPISAIWMHRLEKCWIKSKRWVKKITQSLFLPVITVR